MKVYVVGQVIKSDADGQVWDIHGVFSDQRRAEEACADHTYFVGPMELDVPAPQGRELWPGLYWPKATAAEVIITEIPNTVFQ